MQIVVRVKSTEAISPNAISLRRRISLSRRSVARAISGPSSLSTVMAPRIPRKMLSPTVSTGVPQRDDSPSTSA